MFQDVRVWLLFTVIILFFVDKFFPVKLVNKSFKYRVIYLSIIFTAFFITLLVFEYATGILGSKYHFQDDHEYIILNQNIRQRGLLYTIISDLSTDFSIRFRPIYRIIRVFQSLLWGHFTLLHISQLLVITMGWTFSYFFLRKIGQNRCMSFLLAAILYVGNQQEIIWRLGPQEGEGILFLALTLLSIYNYVAANQKKEKRIWICLCFVFTFLLSGIKEAFILFIPLLSIYMAGLEIGNDQFTRAGKRMFGGGRAFTLYSWILFIIELLFIKVFVGTNIGYAGVVSDFGVRDYWISFLESFSYENKGMWYCVFITILLLFMLTSIVIKTGKHLVIRPQKRNANFNIQREIVSIGVLVYAFGVQFVLHAKSGFVNRYLVMLAIIVAIGLVLSNKYINQEILLLMTTVLIFLAMSSGYTILDAAENYAISGKNTSEMLDFMAETIDSEAIIVTTKSEEHALSTLRYLNGYRKMNIKCEYQEEIACDSHCDVVWGETETLFDELIAKGFNFTEYSHHVFGEYSILIRK